MMKLRRKSSSKPRPNQDLAPLRTSEVSSKTECVAGVLSVVAVLGVGEDNDLCSLPPSTPVAEEENWTNENGLLRSSSRRSLSRSPSPIEDDGSTVTKAAPQKRLPLSPPFRFDSEDYGDQFRVPPPLFFTESLLSATH